MKKSKIVDVILFHNEKEILNRRLSYMDEIVDITIIVNYGNTKIDVQKENVYEIKLSGPFNVIENQIYNGIISIFGKQYFKYNDNFIFSKVFEIPNISTLLEEFDKVDYDQNHLFQKKIMWSESYKTTVNHPGPVLFKYKDLQRYTTIFDTFNRCKDNLTLITLRGDCGWNIQTFQNDNELLKSINFWENRNLTIEELNYLKTSFYDLNYPHVKLDNNYHFDLPKIFQSVSREIEFRKPINLLVSNDLIEIEQSSHDIKILVTDFDITSKDFITHNPEYPSRVLYGNKNYEEFKKDFKFDSLLSTLKNLDLIDEDIVHIKIKSESYDSDFTKIYGEFRKSIPSELIRIFSSSQTFLKSFFALFEHPRSH